MTYWGTLKDGTELLLGDPQEVVLSYDEGAPADLLKAVFPAERLWEELKGVTVFDGGHALFRGVVDEQNTRLSSAGFFVEIVARSLEALLLDNEALPMTLSSPSLELLEKRLLSGLGFSRVQGDMGRKRGELSVEKGESCWAVLDRFCGEFLGTEPWADAEGILHCEGLPGREWELTDVRQAEISYLPCKRLSAVWQQSCRGSYDTPYRDGGALWPRQRYLGMQSGKNPKELLEEGRQESLEITVECAGPWWPGRGAAASFSLEKLGRFEGCPVRSAVYCRNRQGEYTRLTLGRGLLSKTGKGAA